MNFRVLIYILFFFELVSCSSQSEENERLTSNSKNKLEIETLIREVYKWHESIENSHLDFEFITNNSFYLSLDTIALHKRVSDLSKTGYFTTYFLRNFTEIGLGINKRILNSKADLYVGELLPFIPNYSEWCDCQDFPDNYWESIAIKINKIENEYAEVKWYWNSSEMQNLGYTVKLKKENEIWKIDYLQGFDSELYFGDIK